MDGPTGWPLSRRSSKPDPASSNPRAANDDDLASLLYTSGTTADPKGVMLTHANFLGEVEAVFNWVDLGPTDALLGVLPLFHVLAQMANLLLPLVKGSRVVYLETLNTTELLRALSERNITAFAVVPQFFYLIHERVYAGDREARRDHRERFRRHDGASTGRCARSESMPGRIFFRKVHDTLGPKMRYLVTGGSRFDPAIASGISRSRHRRIAGLRADRNHSGHLREFSSRQRDRLRAARQ